MPPSPASPAPSAGTPAESCASALPPGLGRERFDLERLALLQLAFAAEDPRRALFTEDLQELLVSAGYQLLPPGGDLAASLPGPCLSLRVEVDLDGQAEEGFAVFRRGSLAASESRCCGPAAAAGAFGDFRRAIAARLGLGRPGMAASLVEPESAEFALRIEAMALFAAGKVGEAARLLEASELVRGDSGLSFRLGRILGAWGSDLQARSRPPLLERRISSGSARLEAQSRQLLERALAALERAIELDGRLALAHFDRARVSWLLGRGRPAERSFREARRLWPTLCEAEKGMAPIPAFEAAKAPGWCGR